MTVVQAIYEDGHIRLLEPLRLSGKHTVVVTVLDDTKGEDCPYSFEVFDKLAGAISVRSDGAANHDRYVYAKGKL